MHRIPLPGTDASLLFSPRWGELSPWLQVALLVLIVAVPIALVVMLYRYELRLVKPGAAVALPAARTILLRADGGDLYATLRHELAHLALHQALRVRVPLWFDEGYASWAAGEWDRLGTLELNLAVVRGAVPDLRGLGGALRGSANTADVAYALAVSAVTELARRNPSETLTTPLQPLLAGAVFEAIAQATTGLTIAQFELEWLHTLRQRSSVVSLLLACGGSRVSSVIP